MLNKGTKFFVIFGVIVILGLWLATGIYTVESDGGEMAVVLRFGEHVDTVETPGLHWHLPAPFETIIKEKTSEPRTIEIGYKTLRAGSTTEYGEYAAVPDQALMLTGDENMVSVETVIQYNIYNVEDYLFNVDNKKGSMIIAAESAIRRVVANHILDEVLTENKSTIQQEIKEDLQNLCDSYGMGVRITAVGLQDVEPPQEVDAAFKDVANAREDKTSFINEAESYKNEVIPKARANAAEMLNKAEAYKEKRIAEAKGDVANFVQILDRYQQGKEVTRTRMYLEMLEEVLPGVEKYIVDSDGNTVKFLPLEQSQVIGSSSSR